ncbi:MAG: SgcJ/EcaC family oxidoreductase [Gammaproteobacteria bacterium]|jgi:uncharacterized protein (TIGR02246 family)|nr:SgcJ/EcaC family oxidoreductase [Gammaproteobacteria bacterium]MBT3858457.1 SgcJ/EcaC family oxidoreductase [Gammaproteobacteria bacterium]MBT3986805.1 SgcJ/EcaC family oxidoreductase [Gammaproteobacteria bacterium]MBT4256795.1 SgcJ/EcaC family oxidoreductase [Gammaproteobacteria bacterium]MBT4582028.1 SgcJ/EcaC family oxidoreductase [Gammaproteobacteria bacterium]
MFKAKLIRFSTLLLSLFILTTASAAERREIPEFIELGNPSASTQSEVEALINSFKSTWATQDTASHIELFSDDAEWINAYARIFRGTEELSVFLRERLFPNFASTVSQQEIVNARLISIRYIDDGAAVIHMYTDGSRGPSAIEGQTLRRTHIHLVAERDNSQWKVVHTAIMDARE